MCSSKVMMIRRGLVWPLNQPFIDKIENHVEDVQHKVFSRIARKLTSGTIRKSVVSVIGKILEMTLNHRSIDQSILYQLITGTGNSGGDRQGYYPTHEVVEQEFQTICLKTYKCYHQTPISNNTCSVKSSWNLRCLNPSASRHSTYLPDCLVCWRIATLPVFRRHRAIVVVSFKSGRKSWVPPLCDFWACGWSGGKFNGRSRTCDGLRSPDQIQVESQHPIKLQ